MSYYHLELWTIIVLNIIKRINSDEANLDIALETGIESYSLK